MRPLDGGVGEEDEDHVRILTSVALRASRNLPEGVLSLDAMKTGMARRELLAGAGLALAAGGVRAQDGGVIDMTAPFWGVYDQDRGRPLAERADRLSRTALKRDLEVTEAGATPREIEAWLPAFDPLAERVRTMRPRIAPLWAQNLDRFSETFPGFRRTNKVRLLMSRFSFLTSCARVRDEYDVLLGLDECVRSGRTGDEDIGVAMAIQSFHAHHYFYNWRMKPTEITPLWMDLWFEGLGLYCAGRMFPKADRARLFTDPRQADAPISQIQTAAESMLRELDVASEDLHARYFGKGGIGPAVALYMLEREGRTRSLPDMVFIPARPARDIVLSELHALSP
jgi:hypothetical protein